MGISSFPIPSSGIPSGNTAARPGNPVIGDTYYNGEKEALEIYNGTDWVFSSAPAGIPTIAVTDVGTSAAYGSAQGAVTFTEGALGGKPESFTVSSSTGGYSATTSGTTTTITVGNNGSWTFSATAFNVFGVSATSPSVTQTLTTVPQAPTIGTATASTSANEITVAWTLGNNGGKNLSAITITPYLSGTTAETSRTAVTTSSTSYTFTEGQLTAGSSYTFKVKATNANGVGLESSATSSATMPNIIQVDYVIVGGGGAGGTLANFNSNSHRCGGGGAGELRSSYGAIGGNGSLGAPLGIVPSTSYAVTIGAAESNTNFGGNNGITGGAGGPGGNASPGADGGYPGGGGASVSNPNGVYSPGNASTYTFAGGSAQPPGNNNTGGGGGGGSASVGGSAAVNVGDANYGGGNGGNGRTIDITGSNVVYAAGGGGGAGGTGGTNAGSGGGLNNAPTAGSANSGSGGGGGHARNQALAGGAGGSGVVILRYPNTKTITVGAGLTSNTNTVGNNKVTKINAGTGNVSWA